MSPGVGEDAGDVLLYTDELGFELLEALDGVPELRLALWKDPLDMARLGHHALSCLDLSVATPWSHRLNGFIREALPGIRAACPGWVGVVASSHDEDTHALTEAAGATFCAPVAAVVDRVENKCAILDVLTEAEVPTAALGIAALRSWADAAPWLERAGGRMVIQAEFGHSGQTTWFVGSREDYEAHAERIAALPRVRISRFIRRQSLTMDACATRQGTAVGPLLFEFAGIPALTPFPGGWCGNYVDQDIFSPELRRAAFEIVRRIGEGLAARGYLGCFGVDLMRVVETGELFVTEVNGRFTGASPMANYVTSASAGAPLIKHHLAEYRGRASRGEIEVFNERVLEAEVPEPLTLLSLSAPAERLAGILGDVPLGGIWRSDGEPRFARTGARWRDIGGPEEALFAPLVVPGEALCADNKTLGYVVTRGLPLDPLLGPHPEAMRVAAALRGAFSWRDDPPAPR